MNPRIHPSTLHQLDALIRNPPHAILLRGPVGIGMQGLINYLSLALDSHALRVMPERDDKVNYAGGTITIDIVRRLYTQTKTSSDTRRLFVIERAETMSIQAQNAFLKLLEEPVDTVTFILVTHGETKLLPTVLSRVAAIDVRRISREQSEALIDDLGVKDATKRSQILFIAEGLPDMLTSLATDDSAFERHVSIVKDARTLLQGDYYQKLQVASAYKADRVAALNLLASAGRLLKQTIADKSDERYLSSLERLIDAHGKITDNGNLGLWLTRAVL